MKSRLGAGRVPALRSPPSRGAWIEMQPCWKKLRVSQVAPLAGGVD